MRFDRLARPLLLGASLSLALGAASAPAADLEALKEQGFARIAIGNEPPFTAVKADGTVSGAGARRRACRLQAAGIPDVVASISEYGAMIPGLQARALRRRHRRPLHEAGTLQRGELLRADPVRRRGLRAEGRQSAEADELQGRRRQPERQDRAPGGGTEERLALEAGVPRDRVIVVPDTQSGITMLQQGRIDVYSLPVLSINAAVKTANDPQIESWLR